MLIFLQLLYRISCEKRKHYFVFINSIIVYVYKMFLKTKKDNPNYSRYVFVKVFNINSQGQHKITGGHERDQQALQSVWPLPGHTVQPQLKEAVKHGHVTKCHPPGCQGQNICHCQACPIKTFHMGSSMAPKVTKMTIPHLSKHTTVRHRVNLLYINIKINKAYFQTEVVTSQ